mmetsp:Transcript_20533/g.42585  ORF Transcript_20533/g.42585 Transcript_20533/m.42585 type:complete len:89 (+) Transcript_20533:80-346(+)
MVERLINWFGDVLGALGMQRKKANILFLGLDNAGKSTQEVWHCLLSQCTLASSQPVQLVTEWQAEYCSGQWTVHQEGGTSILECWMKL